MDYKNGKIYSIRSYQTEDVYIGSTCQPLFKRLYDHRNNYKRYLNNKYHYVTSFEIIKLDDNYIELIELFPCNCKDELFKREGEIIREMDCVNKTIAGRSMKEYYENNKDKIKEYVKEYRENNKDKINEYNKDYRENNKDKINEYRKNNKDKMKEYQLNYYENNKNKINQKIKCDICNIEIYKRGLKKHENSIKHLNNL